jgi:hypothetical protein
MFHIQEQLTKLKDIVATMQQDTKGIKKEMDSMKVEITKLKNEDVENKKKLHCMSFENAQLKTKVHFDEEKKEAFQNRQNKTKFFVSTNEKSTKSPRETVQTAFSAVLNMPAADIMANVKSVEQITPNLYSIKVDGKQQKKLMDKLTSTKSNSKAFKIRTHLTKITRVKKNLLGQICNILNKEKPTTACVPRYSYNAFLYYQPDSELTRVKMSYCEAMIAFKHLLNETDIKNAAKALSHETQCDIALKLLL